MQFGCNAIELLKFYCIAEKLYFDELLVCFHLLRNFGRLDDLIFTAFIFKINLIHFIFLCLICISFYHSSFQRLFPYGTHYNTNSKTVGRNCNIL